jgi:O-antigen/teichoic acid export membrane protein
LTTTSTVRAVSATYAQRIAGTVMAFATTVLIARSLGPDGRGIVAAVTAIAAIGVQIASLGFQSANTFFVAKDASAASGAKMRSLLIGFAAGSALIAALLVLRGLDVVLPTVRWALVWIGLLSIPFAVSVSLLMGLLMGLGRVRFFNLSELLQKGLAFGVILALVIAGESSPTSIIVAGTGVQFVLFLVVLFLISDIPWKASAARIDSLFRTQLSYGLRAFLASLLAFLLLRLNLVMVQQMAGNAAAGHYSVAMAFFDGIYLLPATIALLLFPKLSAMRNVVDRWRESKRISWITLGPLVGLGVFIAAVAEPLVIAVFGNEFAASVPVLYVLLVAVLFYGLNNVISVFLASCGMPWRAVWVWVPALVTNVSLNMLWIPWLGALGAAWSCAVSCLLLLMAQVFLARNIL